MKKLIIFFTISLALNSAWSDDSLEQLKKFYRENYHEFYTPRFCGRNIRRLLKEAHQAGIDTKGANVLSLVGSGFLMTSSFYSRENKDKWKNLGYFHVVLQYKNHIFDFHLAEPWVLPQNEYIRLQFTPPYEPFKIFGVDYTAKGNPNHWQVTAFNSNEYRRGNEVKLWVKKLEEVWSMPEVRNLSREKIIEDQNQTSY